MRGEGRLAAWIALVAALAFVPFSHCHFSASDETGVYDTARSLLVDGDLAIEPGKHIFGGRDGRLYSHFALGQVALALPFVAAGEALGALLPEALGPRLWGRSDERGLIDEREEPGIFGASLYAPWMTGVLVGLFYAFQRRLGASRHSAAWATALLGACTYVATHSVFFLRHTTEAVAILGALFALHGFRETGRAGWLAWGTALASSGVLVRVPAAVSGPALAAYALFALWERHGPGRPRPSPAVVAAALAPPLLFAALHLASNQLRWGTWIQSPMLGQSFLLQGDLLRGLHGLLASPGASVFVYSPLLALTPLALASLWPQRRAEVWAVVGISLGFLWLCGSFHFWHGLWSAPGPRYLFALTPLWLLGLGPWLDAARGRARWLWVALLAVPGAAVQFVLMSVHWRRAVEINGYQAEIVELGFLFDAVRSPVVGCARALLAGEIDVYLWTLARGVPGHPAEPVLAAALGLAWAALFGLALWRLRAAWRVARE